MGKQLATNINETADTSFSLHPHSLVFLETDESEIERIILSLRKNCAIGIDGISSDLLKHFKTILVPPLTHLFNLCIVNGVFPHQLKRALVHPIYKSGDRDRVINYRPISVLPSMSKILERIMDSRLKQFLNANNILASNQYGFRTNTSTNDAVHDLTNHIVETLDNGDKCIGIFLDLAKAFDTISIPRLKQKLERIGVRNSQLKLFDSYLTDRTQCVKIGDQFSDYQPIEYGVPQGSILGPTLFLIYINEMCKLKLEQGKIFAFADDTAIIFTGRTWNDVFRAAQIGLDKVTNWLALNSLSLNVKKTKYLTFSIRKPNITPDNVRYRITAHGHVLNAHSTCDCPKLENAASITYLGVILDDRLNFIEHIDNLAARIRKLIFVFKHLRHVAEPEILKTVYYALCQSLAGYCISTWGGASKSHIIRLERAQRAVLKVATFKPFRYPTKDLYEYCQVLTVRQMFILQIVLRQHKHLSSTGQSTSSSQQIIARRHKFPWRPI